MNDTLVDSATIQLPYAYSTMPDSVAWTVGTVAEKGALPHWFVLHKPQDSSLPIRPRAQVEAENMWINIGLWSVLLFYLVTRFAFHTSVATVLKHVLHIPALNEASFDKPSLPFNMLMLLPSFTIFVLFVHALIGHLLLAYGVVVQILWWQTALALMSFVLITLLLEYLVAFFFDSVHMFTDYITDQLLIFNVSAVLLWPLMVFYFYNAMDIFLYVATGVVAIFSLWRWLRAALIAFHKTFFSPFYIFIYLCSLKILPLLLFLKWVIG